MNVWKQARLPCTVSLVTTRGIGGEVNGSPKSWWSPVSYEPPRLVVAVKHGSDTERNIDETGWWVTHVPGSNEKMATQVLHTAKPLPYGENELDDVHLPWDMVKGFDGGLYVPVVLGMPWFECKMIAKFDVGDHSMYLGEVIASSELSTEGVTDVLLHRGRNVFIRIGEEWKAEPYKWPQ